MGNGQHGLFLCAPFMGNGQQRTICVLRIFMGNGQQRTFCVLRIFMGNGQHGLFCVLHLWATDKSGLFVLRFMGNGARENARRGL
jgi:hypothetical protein